MPNYLFVYGGGMSTGGPAQTSPVQQKKGIEIWTTLFDKLGKAVVEMGGSTRPGKALTRARETDAVAG